MSQANTTDRLVLNMTHGEHREIMDGLDSPSGLQFWERLRDLVGLENARRLLRPFSINLWSAIPDDVPRITDGG